MKAAFCTRRAGKTEAIPAYLHKAAAENPDCVIYYVGITGKRARELMWKPLTRFNKDFSLGCEVNKTLATLYHPNGAEIRLTGADDLEELGKKRGDKVALVVVDEAQAFPPRVLRALVDDVFWPALMDVEGSILLCGTPGVVCSGFWYEITRNEDANSRTLRLKGWEVHEWSGLDNLSLNFKGQKIADRFRAELEAREARTGPGDPSTLREWRGQWVNDSSALFYAFNEERNCYIGKLPEGHVWLYVVGVDLGFDDAFALVVLAFSHTHGKVYEVESFKRSGLTSSQQVEKIREAVERWNPVAVKVDRSGAVKATVEDWRFKYGLPVEPADKAGKPAYVANLNAALMDGTFLLLKDGAVAGEMAVLPKDPEGPKDKPPREHPSFPNHASDAALYAWREAWQRMGEDKPPEPPRTREKQHAEREARHIERAQLEILRKHRMEEGTVWKDKEIRGRRRPQSSRLWRGLQWWTRSSASSRPRARREPRSSRSVRSG
jgi:hypothetical protein